jgi:endonuclease YncB( thermonuclease family)
MIASQHREESPTVGQDIAEELVKYGIMRVPTDYFYYKEYRYTSLDDALAQAKRQHPAVPSHEREQSGSR